MWLLNSCYLLFSIKYICGKYPGGFIQLVPTAAVEECRVIAMAGGGIVDSQTRFPMANGNIGLMGVAGNGAGMPLCKLLELYFLNYNQLFSIKYICGKYPGGFIQLVPTAAVEECRVIAMAGGGIVDSQTR